MLPWETCHLDGCTWSPKLQGGGRSLETCPGLTSTTRTRQVEDRNFVGSAGGKSRQTRRDNEWFQQNRTEVDEVEGLEELSFIPSAVIDSAGWRRTPQDQVHCATKKSATDDGKPHTILVEDGGKLLQRWTSVQNGKRIRGNQRQMEGL